MKKTKLGKRFFESTRGQIVALLRGSERTVDELSKEVGLTDNAIRGHLLTLERDGLVRQSGLTKGFRKPHFTYTLTSEAEHLFPKPYDTLFTETIDVLKKRISSKELEEIFCQIGREIGKKQNLAVSENESLEGRVKKAVQVLSEFGGVAEISKSNGSILIVGKSCPLSGAVADHPETCKLAESLVEEIVKVEVKERCNREKLPQCRFEITTKK